MEYNFLEIWRFEKHIALSEKKTPLTKSYLNMEGINLFVKILGFFKILSKSRRRKEDEI